MVRFAKTPRGGNIGFHEIPTQCGGGSCWKVQTSDQLGHALSGGCVRQTTEDAIWIYEWAQVGTVVVVGLKPRRHRCRARPAQPERVDRRRRDAV
ncbi:MAG: L,D-transpeptidase [Ilumatobacteraceae bacterium]